MTDIAHQQRDALPSGRQLLKYTVIAIAVAAVVLLTAVLPAEYGIDPTGIGGRLGLQSMSSAAPAPEPAAQPAAQSAPEPGPTLTLAPVPEASTVWKAPRPYRNDELSLTLRPNEGAEIKASMQQGERLVFTWAAQGGAVNFDMHGEKFNAPSNEYTSYWKGSGATTGHGQFTAPYAGTHGWFWRNRGSAPVTVTVKTAGFYEKLYKPQ
ncbi:MAG TPA: transmembrane anchor protein [Burkholderiales bacterium]|nr:transmembrane anchor protein [Burkholderiales bacterium]